MIDSFLKPKGRRSLLFFYQELDLDGSCKYYDKLRKKKIASIDKYKKNEINLQTISFEFQGTEIENMTF